MSTIAIKIKKYSGGVNIVNNNNINHRLFNVVLSSFGFLALFYVLILGGMVYNIVERRSLDSEARALSNEVADLELSYLSMSNKIDLNYAYTSGFKDIKANYANKKAVGSLKLASNEL